MKAEDQSPPGGVRRGLNAADATIQRMAAEWLALREARGFTTAEHAAFAAWCATNPRHRVIFSEVESAWRALDALAAYSHSIDVAADPDLLAPPKHAGGRRAMLPVLAVAACLGVMAVVWFKPWSSAPDQRAVDAPSIAQVSPNVMRLSDGSEVELNTGSEVVEQFTPAERRVRLIRGEAHFSVAKNAARPFVVEAGGVAVRAVGTAFNVRVDPATVEVLVTEGRVQVTPPASTADARAPSAEAVLQNDARMEGAAILTIGQRVVVPIAPVTTVPTPVVETLAPPVIDRLLAWQTSRLVFDATALSDVVAQINRLGTGKAGLPHLSVRDPGLAAMRISGRIRADNIENFVEVLEASFGVVAERRSEGEIVLRRR